VFDKLYQIEKITTNSTGDDDEIKSKYIVSYPLFFSKKFECILMPIKPSCH